MINVRWPDGSCSVETIRIQNNSNTVSDHGKDYDVTYSIAVFDKKVFGVQKTFFLDEI